MTVKIPKSQVDDINLFSLAVSLHAAGMKEWRAHMERVKDDEINEVKGIDRHSPYPPPRAAAIVESAVNENDEIDYEIVDDGPTPEQVLREKKDQLLVQVGQLERAAINAVSPVGKRRLFNIREAAIRKRDAEVVADLYKKRDGGIVDTVATAVGIRQPLNPADIAAAVNAKRNDDEQKHLADQKVRAKQVDAIERASAIVMHDIEDLTAETIGAWQAPDFSKI